MDESTDTTGHHPTAPRADVSRERLLATLLGATLARLPMNDTGEAEAVDWVEQVLHRLGPLHGAIDVAPQSDLAMLIERLLELAMPFEAEADEPVTTSVHRAMIREPTPILAVWLRIIEHAFDRHDMLPPPRGEWLDDLVNEPIQRGLLEARLAVLCALRNASTRPSIAEEHARIERLMRRVGRVLQGLPDELPPTTDAPRARWWQKLLARLRG